MIKKVFFIVFWSWIFSPSFSFACDVCGSNASNIGAGLLTDYRNSFVRLAYFNSRFKTSSEHEYAVSDAFIQYQLSLRHSFGKTDRIKLFASVPFGVNSRSIGDEKIVESGLSDILITGNYAIFNYKELGSSSFLYWETGGGLSLPTGKFDQNIFDRDLPENFNIGRGSLGYFLQTNLVFSHNTMGLVLNQSFQWNEKTETGYRFGEQLNSQASVFWELSSGPIRLIPNLGVSFEHTSEDNFANGKTAVETGGSAFFINPALNLRADQWMLGFLYSHPLSEEYAGGQVNSKGRVSCSFSYIF